MNGSWVRCQILPKLREVWYFIYGFLWRNLLDFKIFNWCLVQGLPSKLEKPCISKGLATCHFLGLIFPCNKVLMVDPVVSFDQRNTPPVDRTQVAQLFWIPQLLAPCYPAQIKSKKVFGALTGSKTNKQTDRQTNKQTNKQTTEQTHTHTQTNQQTSKPTNQQTNKQTNKPTNQRLVGIWEWGGVLHNSRNPGDEPNLSTSPQPSRWFREI